jgi:predicted nucleotidyltransferase
VRDPFEGVTSDGMIRTGADRSRVPAAFEAVLDAAQRSVGAADQAASLYVYGSVANGTARLGESDIDLLTVGLGGAATEIGLSLSKQYSHICRAVQIANADRDDFTGDGAAAYGGRVFLRHYCVHLTGPDRHSGLPNFPADARAARGFNGDIAEHARRWRIELDRRADPVRLSRQIGRKSLLAVAGLVSLADGTWTTDRATGAKRWSEIEPELSDGLGLLLEWSEGAGTTDEDLILESLRGVVDRIVSSFQEAIGLWGTADPL